MHIHVAHYRPSPDPLATRAITNHATFLADAWPYMSEKAYLNSSARYISLLVLDMVEQMEPHFLARVDVEGLLKCISAVVDGERVQAETWGPLAPGWRGDDLKAGTKYNTEELQALSGESLKLMWNSDSRSEIPYGNVKRMEQSRAWKNEAKAHTLLIPVGTIQNAQETDSIPLAQKAVRYRCMLSDFAPTIVLSINQSVQQY